MALRKSTLAVGVAVAAAMLAGLIWMRVGREFGPRAAVVLSGPASQGLASQGLASRKARLALPEGGAHRTVEATPLAADDMLGLAPGPAPRAPFLLHVRDSETGMALRGLEVHTTQDSRRERGPLDVERLPLLTRSGLSPLAIPGRGALLEIFVRSPGHAWGRAYVMTTPGNETLVELDPGGTIEVRFAAGAPPAGSSVQLAPLDRRAKDYTVDVGEGANGVAFGVLRHGNWRVRLLGPGTHALPVLMVQRDFEHREARTVVLLDCWGEGELARLSGTLSAPGWERDEGPLTLVRLRVDGRRETNHREDVRRPQLDGSRGAYTWDGGSLEPGWWSARFGEQELARFELRPPGRGDLALAVAAPTDLEVLLDRPEDSPHGFANFHACYEPVAPGLAGAEIYVPPAGELGRHFARVPSGSVRLQRGRGEIVLDPEWLELAPGPRSVRVRTRAAQRMVIRPFERGEPVFRFDAEWVRLDRAGARVVSARFEVPESEVRVELSEPGSWTLQVAENSGYEAVPPREVLVRPGVETVVELDLTPFRKLR